MISSERTDTIQTNIPQFKEFDENTSSENGIINDLKNARFSKVNIEIEGNLQNFDNLAKMQPNV